MCDLHLTLLWRIGESWGFAGLLLGAQMAEERKTGLFLIRTAMVTELDNVVANEIDWDEAQQAAISSSTAIRNFDGSLQSARFHVAATIGDYA